MTFCTTFRSSSSPPIRKPADRRAARTILPDRQACSRKTWSARWSVRPCSSTPAPAWRRPPPEAAARPFSAVPRRNMKSLRNAILCEGHCRGTGHACPRRSTTALLPKPPAFARAGRLRQVCGVAMVGPAGFWRGAAGRSRRSGLAERFASAGAGSGHCAGRGRGRFAGGLGPAARAAGCACAQVPGRGQQGVERRGRAKRRGGQPPRGEQQRTGAGDRRARPRLEASQRFEIALRNTDISMAQQNHELRYLWVHNAPKGIFGEFARRCSGLCCRRDHMALALPAHDVISAPSARQPPGIC